MTEKKPTKGRIVFVKIYSHKQLQNVDGETEHPAIVTKVLDENEGMSITATAFSPNGYTTPVTAHHESLGKENTSSWRWPPRE